MIEVVPVDLKTANAFVAALHRHHKPVPGAKFCIGAAHSATGKLCGVAIVGRPVARMLDDGWTLEVNRCCTDGTRNACSMLYGAAWKAARAIGFRKIITYTLPEEGGASLRATGWTEIADVGGGQWRHTSGPRNANPHSDFKAKTRWEISTPKPDFNPRLFIASTQDEGEYCQPSIPGLNDSRIVSP